MNARDPASADDVFDIVARLLIEAVYQRYCQDFRGYAARLVAPAAGTGARRLRLRAARARAVTSRVFP